MNFISKNLLDTHFWALSRTQSKADTFLGEQGTCRETFGILDDAQALSECNALLAAKRRVILWLDARTAALFPLQGAAFSQEV
tara:strand:- start:619 stop:867 length:249 start_codon:yes stop_codon:yes gene_type:complete